MAPRERGMGLHTENKEKSSEKEPKSKQNYSQLKYRSSMELVNGVGTNTT